MGALQKIREAGFAVSLAGDSLEIIPASTLTTNQRVFLKQHKAEIITELRAETSGLSVANRQKLLAYLDAIGETDQASIDEYLTECENNPETLARELQHADDCLQIKTGDYSGLVQCSGCNHLSGDTCNRHGWRVVLDKWRRCTDFEPLQKNTNAITCKSCGHFKSYHKHGGGAGSCLVRVMPNGACWWANTVHECNQYQAMEAEK